MPLDNFSEMISFILNIADLLRGPYRPNQYKDVMLPMIVLRRLDCVLESTKKEVLAKLIHLKKGKIKNIEPILNKVAGQHFHNTSQYTFEKLKDDPDNIASNLVHYIKSFSTRARQTIEYFGFEDEIEKLDKSNKLYLLVSKFCEVDFHPDNVSTIEMGYIFEDLIRRFNEASNEEAGDYFTPREVIRLMVDLLFLPDHDFLTTKGIVKTLYDPTCGTGGMLSVSEEYLRELNSSSMLEVFGQDYNPQAYAICSSDMMIKGQNLDNISYGDSFLEDQFRNNKFDYMLANPPFGVKWESQRAYIKREHEEQGYSGRFGAGLPRVTDGSLLFLQHMLSKMKHSDQGGTRFAIVFNASPLSTGEAGSGESEIRKRIIENDWLETIVALPENMFYNTGINTYICILTNRKEPKRQGTIQLIDASTFFSKLRRNLGEKRYEINDEQRRQIVEMYINYRETEFVKIIHNSEFGYKRIRLERPLRLSFSITKEGIDQIRNAKRFQQISSSKKRKGTKQYSEEIEDGLRKQQLVLEILERMIDPQNHMHQDCFIKRLKEEFILSNISLSSLLLKEFEDIFGRRNNEAEVCKDKKGNTKYDLSLRDYENVPLNEDVGDYITREVLPHFPDVWIDNSWTRTGYEINFRSYFYRYNPPRHIDIINEELETIEDEISKMLKDAIG